MANGDDLLFQAGIEGTDEITDAAEQIGEAWTEAMQKASEAVKQAGSAFDELEEHTKDFGGDFSKGFSDELSKLGGEAKSAMGELGSVFGEGGEHVKQFAEKAGGALREAFTAFQKIGPAVQEAGGGLSGLLGSGEALGAAMAGLAAAIGTVVVAGIGLALSMAHVAEEMDNLKASVEGSEEDFTKLENVATSTGISLQNMVGIANATRDAFRQMSLEMANAADMIRVMAERMEDSQARIAAAQEKQRIKQIADPKQRAAAEEAFQKQQDAQNLKQMQTFEDRAAQRTQRELRAQGEGARGLQRLYQIDIDFNVKDPKAIEQVAAQMDKVQQEASRLKDLPIGDQISAALTKVNEVLDKSPEKLNEVQRALVEAYGPQAARLIEEHAEAIRNSMETSAKAAEKVSAALGNLSPAERESLTKLSEDLRQLGTDFENFALHVAAVIAPIADAFIQVAHAITEHFNNGLRAIGEAVNAVGDLLQRLKQIALEVADGFLQLAANVLHLIGAFSSAAENMAKSLEALRAKNEQTIQDISRQQAQANQPAEQQLQQQAQPDTDIRKYASPEQLQQLQGEGIDIGRAPDQVKGLGDAAGAATDNLNRLAGAGRPSGGMAAGGAVRGPGSSTSDSIPAFLSTGEYVVNAAAVSHYGVRTFHALNARQFAAGGFVGFQGGGLSHGAANVGGGSSLHPVTMVMPSGRAVGGFSASPSAVAAFSHEAAVRRSTSIGRHSSAEG